MDVAVLYRGNYFQKDLIDEHFLLFNIKKDYCSERIGNEFTVIKVINHATCANRIQQHKKVCNLSMIILQPFRLFSFLDAIIKLH